MTNLVSKALLLIFTAKCNFSLLMISKIEFILIYILLLYSVIYTGKHCWTQIIPLSKIASSEPILR
jgi:hypothetical protein